MQAQQDQACDNLRWALALLKGLIEGGLRHLVLSPGSRSTPIVLAAQRLAELELTTIVDERSAAFFALGVATASEAPVGLVCTSGSAPAHWLPAVIEASESDVPLVLLSADRPPELRGWGANQTIDQAGLFGSYARELIDPGVPDGSAAALKMINALGRRAASTSRSPRPGPVHLNLPFREPLVPGAECAELALPITTAARSARGARAARPSIRAGGIDSRDLEEALTLIRSGRGVICCGPGLWSPAAAEALWQCAERLQAPVLCDPLSGLRFGPGSPSRITRYDSFLRSPAAAEALRPEWVLRFGRAPVSKTLQTWLAGIPAMLVSAAGRWSDPGHDARAVIAAHPESFCRALTDAPRLPIDAAHAGWSRLWHSVEMRTHALAADFLAGAPWCEAQLIRSLLDALPAGEGLLCANSMPIRQLDTWSGARETELRIFCNRGASGIDGQSSTLAGLQAGGTPSAGLVGDLSFLHDLSGLLLLRQIRRPCIVINNGGGRIFDYLPQHQLPGFEDLWRTPVDIAIDRLADAFELRYTQVSDAAGFDAALRASIAPGAAPPDAQLIEVRMDGDLSHKAHCELWGMLRGTRLL